LLGYLEWIEAERILTVCAFASPLDITYDIMYNTHMNFKLQPYQHQKQAIDMARKHPDLALFWEMGTGKTGGLINILRTKYEQIDNRRTLIFAPLVTLHNWKDEFGIHSFDNECPPIIVLDKSGKARMKQFDKYVKDKDAIVVVNYEALRSKELYVKLFNWEPSIVVMDESHKLKNPQAKQAKLVITIADRAEFRYILTGTPILNNAMDVFNQYRALDGGKTFGKNFYTFRARYFYDANAHMPRHVHFPNWQPIKSRYKELSKKLYAKALRVKKEDCLDLPPLVKQIIKVPLGKDQARMYKEMRDSYVTFIRDTKTNKDVDASIADNALTKLLRLQQLVSGHIKTESGDIVVCEDNPRLKITKELLEELTVSNKVIVWTAFKYDITAVSQLCTDLGIKYTTLSGEQNGAQKRDNVELFRRGKDVRVIIANRVAGGIGINLVEASYSIVYSRNFSLDAELQSEARNYRGGSQIHQKITKLDLCANGTIDELVLQALRGKEDIAGQIIDWTEKL